MNKSRMKAKDSISGSLAECYVTLNERRYNFMTLTEFTSKYKVNIVDVPILGQTNTGHKAVGGKGTWSGKAHYNQSHLRAVALAYQNTGVMPYFQIQVTNEDPTSAVGRQTIIHYDCLCEEFTLAMLQAGENNLVEDLSGTFGSWDMPEEFTELEGT